MSEHEHGEPPAGHDPGRPAIGAPADHPADRGPAQYPADHAGYQAAYPADHHAGYPETGDDPEFAPPGEPELGRGRVIAVAVLTTLVIAALGAPLGWLWSVVAPRVGYIKADGGFYYADSEPEQAIAADGWFLIIGIAAGLVLAVLVWFALRRYRGVAILVALAVGSLGGAMLAWWVGHKIGMTQFDTANAAAANGDRINGPLGLRVTNLSAKASWKPLTTGVAAGQALVAALVYTCLAGFSVYENLRGPGRRPAPPSPGPTDPTAADHPPTA